MIPNRDLHWALFWLLLAGVAGLTLAALAGVDGEESMRAARVLAHVVLSVIVPQVLP
jgi:hypothetical protein